MTKIGVEESLTNIKEALREKGYDVVELKREEDARGCDLCVVTGLDQNMMGMHDTHTAGPIIDASGRSAEDICQEVENKIH